MLAPATPLLVPAAAPLYTAPAVLASVTLDVRHECDVARVIAATIRLCSSHALNSVFAAHVATAASELANNLWMYTWHGGQVRLQVLADGGRRGVAVQAEDHGPGIADVRLALTEGYSTGGGMGCGLSGVQRLMDEFEIRSHPGQGTLVQARKWLNRPR